MHPNDLLVHELSLYVSMISMTCDLEKSPSKSKNNNDK
jgi:hypothetical protein